MAEQIGTNNINKLSLLPANSFENDRSTASSTLVFKVPTDGIFTVSFIIASSMAVGNAGEIYVATISRSTSGVLSAKLKSLLPGTSLNLKYKINSDKSVDVVKYRSQYSPVIGCLILSGNRFVTNLTTDISDSEIDDTFIGFTEVE